MWTPPMVGYFVRPALMGTVRTVAALLGTVMVWALVSTVVTWASPTVKCSVRSASPQPPLPASRPANLATTVMCSPAGQYWRGRKWISRGLTHRHAPSTGIEGVTDRAWVAAARLGIRGLKRRGSGMPTPTVWPSAGGTVGLSRARGRKGGDGGR